jgi:hypothetical protein
MIGLQSNKLIKQKERGAPNGYQTIHNRKPTCRKNLSLP